MSFESDVKKLQKMWDRGQDNTNKVSDSQNLQAIKEAQIGALPPAEIIIDSLTDIGGKFKDIQVLMAIPYVIKGFEWTISKVMPEVWIPSIRVTVGYNYPGGASFTNVQTFYNTALNVVPVSGSNGMVTATWDITLFLAAYDPTVTIPDFQAKLYFTLVDPSQLV